LAAFDGIVSLVQGAAVESDFRAEAYLVAADVTLAALIPPHP